MLPFHGQHAFALGAVLANWERWPSRLVATAAEDPPELLAAQYMIHAHQWYEHYTRERVREATAVYFEWLAQKETRDYDRRQQLSEMAHFYRSLTEIIAAQKETRDYDRRQRLSEVVRFYRPLHLAGA